LSSRNSGILQPIFAVKVRAKVNEGRNMSANYPTKYAANRLNVTTNTVRNWSEQYAEYLSLSAQPGQQSERRFTEKDLTVLEYIKQLRSEGLKESEIKQRLAETRFADVEVLSPSENTPQAPQSTKSAIEQPALPDTPHATPAPIVALDDHEKRLALLERSVRPSWWWFVAGIAAGLGMAAIAELAAIVARR
jgi:DNA-binding transcriptional MerR regulator